MCAFAANSLLCREALAAGHMGAASFTLIRVISGALVLGLIFRIRFPQHPFGGSWLSAAALFAYAGAFSYAYVSLSAGTGALLLFGAVQMTMVIFGLWRGERLGSLQVVGMLVAAAGLVWLLLPGVASPPWFGALLMLGAGFAWGLYSLLGRGVHEPTFATAGNFVRAVPFALMLYFLAGGDEQVNGSGVAYAVASGALASGMGYALWYRVLPALPASTAATAQLSVPVLAALGGTLLLGEALTLRFAVASIAVLGGIGMFVLSSRRA